MSTDPDVRTAAGLIEVIGLAAAKMCCRECGAQPCALVFVKVKTKRGAKLTQDKISVDPGFCAAHLPKPVRKKKREASDGRRTG